MAKAIIKTDIKPQLLPADVWDGISGTDLHLNREETKILFTLLGQLNHVESGRAGEHAKNLFVKIAEKVYPKDPIAVILHNNLKIRAAVKTGPDFPGKMLTYRIVDKVTGEVA